MKGKDNVLFLTTIHVKYERLISDTQIDAAITEAENEAEDGVALMDAREVLSGLRRKYAK